MIIMICITIVAIALAGYFARRAKLIDKHRIRASLKHAETEIAYGAKIKIVTGKNGNVQKVYYVARSVVPTDKTRMLLDPIKMGKGTISIYDYAKRSRTIVEPNSKNEIKSWRDR